MADNTILNPGTSGDTVRDLARQGGSVKTQAMQLDLGGPSINAEVLIEAGQQASASSMPVVIAGDQGDTAQTRLNAFANVQKVLFQARLMQNGPGFVPFEFPGFLAGI